MLNYQTVDVVLDAYHELESGNRVAAIEEAANRLNYVDPANEMLPELKRKIRRLRSQRDRTASKK
jgi:hypothetical protein